MKVFVINKKTIPNFLDNFNEKNWLIFFHWDKCGYCHKIRPVWDELVSNNINKDINFAEIENSDMEPFLKQTNSPAVRYFPYFMLYKKGLNIPFNDETNINTFNNFINKNISTELNEKISQKKKKSSSKKKKSSFKKKKSSSKKKKSSSKKN